MSLKATITGSSLCDRLMHAVGSAGVIGIAYHGTTATRLGGLDNVYGKHIDAATLRRHLDFITRRYRVIRLSELVEKLNAREPLPRRAVFLTFDDCYVGNFEVAFPLLREFGISATFFAPTHFAQSGDLMAVDILDGAIKHTDRKQVELVSGSRSEKLDLSSESARVKAAIKVRAAMKAAGNERESFLEEFVSRLGFASLDQVPPLGDHARICNAAQLREMADAGMEIGSHTHSHQSLARMDAESARSELQVSKKILEEMLGRTCPLFCYPNGRFPDDGNCATNALVKDAGYQCAVYLHGTVNFATTDPFLLGRTCFGQDTEMDEIRTALAMAGPRIRSFIGKDNSPAALAQRS